MQFEDLLKGNEIVTTLDEQIVFSQLKISVTAIWSMLLASGYLKVTEHMTDEKTIQKQQKGLDNRANCVYDCRINR